MAGYEALRPEILANEIMVDRERDTVFKNICYKGPMIGYNKISQMGDTVRIPGIGRPTVTPYTGANISYEQKQASQQIITIDQAQYVAVQILKVDEKQAQMDIIKKEITEAKRALAVAMDEWVAGFHTQAGSTVTNATATSANIISTLTQAETALLDNDVPAGEMMHLVVSPAVYEKMKLAKIIFQQTNKEVFGKGFIGSYLNFNVHVSNSIKKTGDVNHCMALTPDAMALIEQIPASEIKLVDPELNFGKAFKVLHLYGGKVIRPSELVVLNITTAVEAVV